MTTAFHAPCDRAIAQAAPAAGGGHAAGVLATTILASSLAFVDGSVVNVGLPAIGRDVGGGAALAWVLNGYTLPLSALLLIGGAAGDAYGRRRLLIAGTVLFALASLLCALAPGLPWLVAGRVLQGAGAALLMPNSLAILGGAFSGAERGRAIGTWAAAGAAAGAAGPLLGGWLVDSIGWRTIFLVNLPLTAAAVVLALRYVPGGTRDPEAAALDWPGGALATLALGALTYGLTAWSAAQHVSAAVLAALAGGAAAGAAFVAVERRRGERAMMPLALFAAPDFIGLTLLTLLLYGALGVLLVLLPYALIAARGYSATAAGAALLPLPLVLALGSSAMGKLAARIGPRWPLTVGPCVAALGCVLALRVTSGGSYWTTVFPALIVVSLGMAGAVAPLTTAVLASVDGAHNGVASGFNSAVARTGGLVATALLGGLLALHGAALAAPFRVAMLTAAAAALAAGACAFVWVGRSGSSGG